jgi:hypothetical protein
MVSQQRRPLREKHNTSERTARAMKLRGARKNLAKARAELFVARKLPKIQNETMGLLLEIPNLTHRLAQLEKNINKLQRTPQQGNRERMEAYAIQLNGIQKELDTHYHTFLKNNAAFLQFTADALNSGGGDTHIRTLRANAWAQRTELSGNFQSTQKIVGRLKQRLGITE